MKGSWKGTFALACAVAFAVACGSSSKGGFNADGLDGSAGGLDDGGNGGFGTNGEGGSGEGGGPGGSAPVCADIVCACGLANGQWDGTTCTVSENPGNVSAATQGQLQGGGSADSTFKLVYPYDATVFARGLLAPTLQWNGTATDATYVHISAPGLDYKGWFGSSNPGRAKLDQKAWDVITIAPKPTDPVKVEVTKISGGKVSGPATQSWKMAAGSLRGIIYYETYGSALAGGLGGVGIMKISPGATKPVPLASGCGNVCHTASADGSTLVSATGFIIGSQSIDLKTGAVIKTQGDQSLVYGGLTPNGKLSMSATNYRTWTGAPSKLYDTTTGTAVAAPGWDGVVTHAAMPAFAPDATMIAFNHQDNGNGHTIATMSYNASTHAFSGLVDVANDPARYLGWPAFTPDTKSVVYHSGTSAAYETDLYQDDAGGSQITYGDLYSADIGTKKSTRLDKLDGYTGPGSASYLPANDPDLNFAPTVLPEAVGGYFWVVFTSHRSYGNTLGTRDNNDQNGKLWVAAVDISPTAGVDPSHPAFYLDGQESGADNLRGFWVLNPCKDDGNGCASGDECCGGYCRPNSAGLLACSNVPPPCANEYEKCAQASDCCATGAQCINGKCAAPAVK